MAKFDGPVLAGLKPESGFQPRELYIDRRQLSLPPDLPSGSCLPRIRFYNRENEE